MWQLIGSPVRFLPEFFHVTPTRLQLNQPVAASAMLLTLLLCCGCAERIDSWSEFVEVAYRHERNGELPEAVAAYRKALELDPKAAVTWYDLGVAYAGMEQFEDAVEAYSTAIQLDPEMARAFNNRAAVFASLKQFAKAVDDCDNAIALQPDDFLAWRNRGLAKHDLGQFDEAITDYDASIRLNGTIAETYHFRGNAYLDRLQWQRALDDFDRAIELTPNLAAAWLSRAKALSHLERSQDVTVALAKAEELGADISTFEPAQISTDIAPPPTEFTAIAKHTTPDVDPRRHAVEFVRNWLTKTQHREIADSGFPWDLRDSDEEMSAAYVVRIVNSREGGHDVRFPIEQLQSIMEARDIRTTLIVVRPASASDDTSANPAFELVRTLEDWKPDLTAMSPVEWSLPVTEGD
ncbi:MAG: tetratricopeptide repeat protein [Planctomycetaceae bacterium]